MAPRGRPPKPIEQKRVTGNPGKRALPDVRETTALEPVTHVPTPPDDIGSAGLIVWANAWTSGHRWLALADTPTVERIARTADHCAALRDEIDRYGLVIDGPVVTLKGDVVEGVTKLYANPAVAMLRAAERQLERDESNLGFNPVARSRLGLAEVKTRSVVEQLLAKRQRRAQGEDVSEDVIDVEAED